MSLYKMKFEFSRQSWYDSEGVYKLVEKQYSMKNLSQVS